MSVRVLFEDPSLLAVDKPPGVLSVRGRLGEKEPALVDLLAKERGEKLFIVHRIDRGTSGVLLFARNAEAHRTLSRAFEQGRVAKRYLALVKGEPPLPEFSLEIALVSARRGKARPAAKGEAGKASTTRFKVLERFKGFALLEAVPKTGRAHQIRVHLKYAGFPLAVDGQYAGIEKLTRKDLGLEPGREAVLERTPLHAQRVAFAHPVSGQEVVVDAPLPPDFETALGLLRGL